MGTSAVRLAALTGAFLLTLVAPALGASKNVELLDNLPGAKHATAINFLSYDKGSDVMLVTGRFGLRSYC